MRVLAQILKKKKTLNSKLFISLIKFQEQYIKFVLQFIPIKQK